MHFVSSIDMYTEIWIKHDTVLPLWLRSQEEIVYREFVLAYLWASQGYGKRGHAAGRGFCTTQPSCYSSREANSLVCTWYCCKVFHESWCVFTRLVPDLWYCSGLRREPWLFSALLVIFFWVFTIWQPVQFQKRCQGLDLCGTEEGKNVRHR